MLGKLAVTGTIPPGFVDEAFQLRRPGCGGVLGKHALTRCTANVSKLDISQRKRSQHLIPIPDCENFLAWNKERVQAFPRIG
jgi:hypothetical protein